MAVENLDTGKYYLELMNFKFSIAQVLLKTGDKEGNAEETRAPRSLNIRNNPKGFSMSPITIHGSTWTVSKTKSDGDLSDDLNELGVTFPPLESPPVQFATENSTVVTSQTGSTALVPCVVNNIGDGMVSWIRRKDYHLLTVGLTTYSSDERFQAIHLQHSEDWTLQIKYVQKRDAGLYECQVSSHPPTSIFIQLNVVEARAEISGPSEKYLKPGSGLRLQCTVLQSTEPPVYVFWYHNNRMINYDVDRGINVTTELAAKTSTLTITSAATRHSGNYSCVPSNAQPASTYVHILNGENPAAMQHGGRGLSWLQCSPSSWLLIISIVIALS